MNEAIEGVEVLRAIAALSVRISREAAPPEAEPGTPAHTEWERLRGEMPRLYNGPVLAVVSLEGDDEVCEIVVRRDTFQRLIVQPRVRTGVRILAVTGVLTARSADGREHVFLGRRSPQTRIYGDQWELGPSGGVSAPPGSTFINAADLAGHLDDEISEETGLHSAGRGVPFAILRDHVARSDDVALRVDLGSLEPILGASRPANWEYTQTQWIPVEQVRAFDREHAAGIIAPTRALFRLLGWA